jgi:hypothetical protein
MNKLEQKNLLQAEAQVSDELNDSELNAVNGGCGKPDTPPGDMRRRPGENPIQMINRWLRTDDGPNLFH